MKKLVSLALALALLLSCAAIPAFAADSVGEVNIVGNFKGNGLPDTDEDNFYYNYVLEKTGIAVHYRQLEDYYTSLNLMITGGEMPDMLVSDVAHMHTYADQGLLLDLNDYKEQLAPVFAYTQDVDLTSCYYDGGMYLLPRRVLIGDNCYRVMYVRQDYMDKLGVTEAPTTVDGLFDLVQKMVTSDLDGNGANDTIGLVGSGLDAFNALASAYGVAMGSYVVVRDGKVTNSLLDVDAMKAALEMCKKWVDAGLVNPDLFVSSTTRESMINGTSCVSYFDWSNYWKTSYLNQTAAVSADTQWTWASPVSAEGFTSNGFGVDDIGSLGRTYAISADISDEHLESLITYLNWLTTEEGEMATNYGLEGNHWVYGDNKEIKMTENYQDANWVNTYQFLGRNDEVYLSVKFPEAKDVISFVTTLDRYFVYNGLIVEPAGFYLSDMNDYVNQALIDFIYGTRNIAEYETFIQELYSIYNFQDYMDAATEQLIALGIAAE